MIARLIRASIANRGLVLLAAVLLAVWGIWSVLTTPLAMARRRQCLFIDVPIPLAATDPSPALGNSLPARRWPDKNTLRKH